MAKRIGPSGRLAIFRSRQHQQPSTLGGCLWLDVAPFPPRATLEEVS
jgi:hypothetical protein